MFLGWSELSKLLKSNNIGGVYSDFTHVVLEVVPIY